MEHLGARLIGWDAGISLTAGVSQEALRKTPLFARAVDILRGCEELRRENSFDEAAKARLRNPAQRFSLFKTPEGKTRFRQTFWQSQTIASGEAWTREWAVTNSLAEQPLKFRIEALISSSPGADTNAVIIADLANDDAGNWKRTSAEGVRYTVASLTGTDSPLTTITATNTGKVPRNAAWARLEKRFEPPLNAKEGKALAVEIDGDGSGALVAIRLECPQHISYGAIADRYVPINFTGRRTFTLVETESSQWSDYTWNDGKHLYGVYRELVNFGALESASIWLQNLPTGRETRIRIGPIRALPLRPTQVKNPRLTINGQTLELPVELAPGNWIEGNSMDDCLVYGQKGEALGKIVPRGDWPRLRNATKSAGFDCAEAGEIKPRARVTIFGYGDVL
jgi:hypothetical protein